MKWSSSFLIFLMVMNGPLSVLAANDKLKDFRGTSQSLALVGVTSEFVEPGVENRLLEDLRRKFNRYSKSYGTSSIDSFKMGANSGKQLFRPVADTPSESQKKFLQATCKDNSVDIIVLGTFKQVAEEIEIELQLFDSRIEAFSKIEKARLRSANDLQSLDDLVYRAMNYMDREGYVYNTPQDFLEPPVLAQASRFKAGSAFGSDDLSVNPLDIAGGSLAGEVSVGGDKVPFWEKWWFWAIVGGGLVTAGSLSYYFLVVDQPPSSANVGFRFP